MRFVLNKERPTIYSIVVRNLLLTFLVIRLVNVYALSRNHHLLCHLCLLVAVMFVQ